MLYEFVIVDLDGVGGAYGAGEKQLEVFESLAAVVFA